MIIQARVLLALLATVGCAEGVMVAPRASLSRNTNDATARTEEAHPPIRTSLSSVTNYAIASTEEVHPPTRASLSPTTNDATASPEESHPPIHSSFFTTDATSGPNILTLPRNESVSRLLFWPPSAGINVTLDLTVAHRNYTFYVTTAFPQHWHSIDIYQPTEGSIDMAKLYLYTEQRYLNLEHSRVLQVQVGSALPTYWCFCPRPHLCTMLSPLKEGGDSSGKRTDLLVALLVVVFLLIVTLLALVGVTFYKKSELFHIYAKPIDCLPHAPPPPLPTPNRQPARHVNKSAETKQIEAEEVSAKTDQTDDSEYSRVGGDDADNAAHPSPPAINSTYDRLCKQQQKHESINSLYGLV